MLWAESGNFENSQKFSKILEFSKVRKFKFFVRGVLGVSWGSKALFSKTFEFFKNVIDTFITSIRQNLRIYCILVFGWIGHFPWLNRGFGGDSLDMSGKNTKQTLTLFEPFIEKKLCDKPLS